MSDGLLIEAFEFRIKWYKFESVEQLVFKQFQMCVDYYDSILIDVQTTVVVGSSRVACRLARFPKISIFNLGKHYNFEFVRFHFFQCRSFIGKGNVSYYHCDNIIDPESLQRSTAKLKISNTPLFGFHDSFWNLL